VNKTNIFIYNLDYNPFELPKKSHTDCFIFTRTHWLLSVYTKFFELKKNCCIINQQILELYFFSTLNTLLQFKYSTKYQYKSLHQKKITNTSLVVPSFQPRCVSLIGLCIIEDLKVSSPAHKPLPFDLH
jgi:hypothetical protein